MIYMNISALRSTISYRFCSWSPQGPPRSSQVADTLQRPGVCSAVGAFTSIGGGGSTSPSHVPADSQAASGS